SRRACRTLRSGFSAAAAVLRPLRSAMITLTSARGRSTTLPSMRPRGEKETEMAYDGYECLTILLDRGVAFVTIDHPPINLLDLALINDLDRVGRQLEAD